MTEIDQKIDVVEPDQLPALDIPIYKKHSFMLINRKNFPQLMGKYPEIGIDEGRYLTYRYGPLDTREDKFEMLLTHIRHGSLAEIAMRLSGLRFPGRSVWYYPAEEMMEDDRQHYNFFHHKYDNKVREMLGEASVENVDYRYPSLDRQNYEMDARSALHLLVPLRLCLGIDNVGSPEELNLLIQQAFKTDTKVLKQSIRAIAKHNGGIVPEEDEIELPPALNINFSQLWDGFAGVLSEQTIERLISRKIIVREEVDIIYANATDWMTEIALSLVESSMQKSKSKSQYFYPYPLKIAPSIHPPVECLPYIEEAYLTFLLQLPGIISEGHEYAIEDMHMRLRELVEFRNKILETARSKGVDGVARADAVEDFILREIQPHLINLIELWRRNMWLWNKMDTRVDYEAALPSYWDYAESIRSAGGRGPRHLRIRMGEQIPRGTWE